jgi:hypothetical protein
MKFSDAMYAWTKHDTVSAFASTAGQIKVGPHPDMTGWSDDFAYSGGSCFLALKEKSEIEQVAKMFIDFHSIIVRDGIDPQLAHKEFLKIDEYRRYIAPDIEGAELDE